MASLALCVPVFGQEAPASQPASQPAESQPASRNLDFAADSDVELLEMEIPVVVTAMRRRQEIATIPHAVSVITAEDIRRSGARSVPDALRLAAGMDVAELTASHVAASPRGLQGFTSRTTLVLVDGRQLFDSFFGGMLWACWPLQVEDIERIEVIRGPGGVTWGANAVNGVVNIITKDPRDQRGVTISAGGGSRGFHKTHLGYGYADEKLRFRISGEYEGHDGFKRGDSWLRKLDDRYRIGRIGVHGVYEIGERDTLTFSAGSGLTENGYPSTPMTLFSERQAGSQASYLLGRWTRRVSPGNSFEITGYVNDFHGSPGIRSIDYRYQQYALQFGHTFKPVERHTLTWGIDTRFDYTDTANSDPFMLTEKIVRSGIIGLYAQDQWQFAPRWTLDLGGRVDYETYGGFQPSARAALAHQFSEEHALYGAVSRAFQMSPAALRFMNLPLLSGLAHATADRDLKAITLLAYELGYRGRYFERLELGVNAFWNEYPDMSILTPRLGPPGLIQLRLQKCPSISMYGVELDARYRATDALTLVGNYTFGITDWGPDLGQHYTDTATTPRHKFMLGARYDATDDLHLSSHLYFADTAWAPNSSFPFIARPIDRYFRLDLQAEYEFWDDRASLAVGVRNLIDSHHHEGGTLFLNDAEVPRMIYAQLRLTLE
jgi:iron complex outermembrane receptor protein